MVFESGKSIIGSTSNHSFSCRAENHLADSKLNGMDHRTYEVSGLLTSNLVFFYVF